MKKRSTTIILVFVLFVGLGVVCYPSFSNWWNSRVQSRAVSNYANAVAAMSETDYSEYFEAAEEFNEMLRELGSGYTLSNTDKLEGYEDILDVTGNGIMGYVTIEKINVELPIYHGTGSSALNKGAGHLEGSSFPIGGEGTHSVISAHRGLPSSLLFTNLDQLEIGDTFTITVLNQVYTYTVDQIIVVLPTEMEDIYIVEGEDYCTLMTCTPYGINTHRLLVRGTRTMVEETINVSVSSEGVQIDPVLAAAFAAVPMLLICLLWMLLKPGRRGR